MTQDEAEWCDVKDPKQNNNRKKDRNDPPDLFEK